MKMKPKQKSLFADISPQRIRSVRDDVLQVIAVDQPNASLLACGEQWLYISPLKFPPDIELALVARWPSPRQLRDHCTKYRDRLLAHGIHKYNDLPKDAFIATGQILSRKQLPSRHSEPAFWKIIEPQLDLVHVVDKGLYAYRLKFEPIRPVPCSMTGTVFKIKRSALAEGI